MFHPIISQIEWVNWWGLLLKSFQRLLWQLFTITIVPIKTKVLSPKMIQVCKINQINYIFRQIHIFKMLFMTQKVNGLPMTAKLLSSSGKRSIKRFFPTKTGMVKSIWRERCTVGTNTIGINSTSFFFISPIIYLNRNQYSPISSITLLTTSWLIIAWVIPYFVISDRLTGMKLNLEKYFWMYWI